ncbi:MAG TPA: YciC family protein [bacterium]|jgi:uncharacterized membrane protein|nr:YciC family protein [bacterium]
MAMAPNPVPIGDAVRYGWTRTMDRLGFWIVLMLIVGVVSSIPQWLSRPMMESAPSTAALINLLGSVISIFVSIGVISISLMVYDARPVSYGDLFSRREVFWRYLGGTILSGLIVALGFLLLIVPGIVWAIKYQFVPYVIVDRGVGATESLRMSARLTDGVKMNLLFFDLALFGVILLGAIALGVGLFVALPVVLMAHAYMYRHRLGAAGGASPVAQPAPVTT